MPDFSDEKAIFYQNLIDAGCKDKLIESCLSLKETNQTNELLQLLFHHKQKLLNHLHEKENQIDSLDYLINQLK